MDRPPITNGDVSQHLPGLDLLRAIAIASVMCFHSYLAGGLNEHFIWLSRFGWMGVDLFFVLSGFLIGSQVMASLCRGRRFSFRAFYIRRAFRILPAFWTILTLYLVLPWFREAPGMEPWWKFASFLMNLSIDYDQNQAFSHAWSLCIEEHFYLLFPWLAWLFTRRMRNISFIALLATVVAIGIGLRTSIWLHDAASAGQRDWYLEDIYYPTWNRLDGLLAGVALACLKAFRPKVWGQLEPFADVALLLGILLLALAIWLFQDPTGLIGNSIGWPVLSYSLALLVFAGAQRVGWLGCRNMPGAPWLAAVSYSLYLIHKPMYHLVRIHFGETLKGHALLAFSSYTAAALLGAALLHYLVERPGLLLRNRALPRGDRGTDAIYRSR